MDEEIVIEEITLFRCYNCGTLITVNEVEEGTGCSKCHSRKMVLAKMTTVEENIRLEKLYKDGKLKLFMTGATV
jgi:DNA-directed RNA polymerase subunit RPC12/RpoP